MKYNLESCVIANWLLVYKDICMFTSLACILERLSCETEDGESP